MLQAAVNCCMPVTYYPNSCFFMSPGKEIWIKSYCSAQCLWNNIGCISMYSTQSFLTWWLWGYLCQFLLCCLCSQCKKKLVSSAYVAQKNFWKTNKPKKTNSKLYLLRSVAFLWKQWVCLDLLLLMIACCWLLPLVLVCESRQSVFQVHHSIFTVVMCSSFYYSIS
jgi:hypothetical protein